MIGTNNTYRCISIVFSLLIGNAMYALQLDNNWILSDYMYVVSDNGDNDAEYKVIKSSRVTHNVQATTTDTYLSPIWKNNISGAEFVIDHKIILYGANDIEHLIRFHNLQGHINSIEEIDGEPIIYILSLNGFNYIQIDSLCSIITNSGYCDIAEPNIIYLTDLSDIAPSQNPLYSKQWQLYNAADPRFDVNAEEAWKLSTGIGVKVAIIDNGFELNHPDLRDNFLEGYDCTNGKDGAKKGAYKIPQDSHGTQCAGVIGALDNKIGVLGIAPNCRIIPIRHSYSVKKTDEKGNEEIKSVGSSTYSIKAIRKAYNSGADVISNSWSMHGITESTIYDLVIDEAISKGRNGLGCVVVFSTGNQSSSSINYPSNHPGTLSVGATDKYGHRASFSNYGERLDVVAPGEKIYTTQVIPFNSYTISSGTSFACPMVAGIAALILSIAPQLRWEDVCTIIRKTAYKLPTYTFNVLTNNGSWNSEIGYGSVDALAAVKETQRKYIQNKTFSSSTPEIIYGTSITVGYRVTNNTEFGNVTILPNSSVSLLATDVIRITNGFQAKSGSNFSARITTDFDWIATNSAYTKSHIQYIQPNKQSPTQNTTTHTPIENRFTDIKERDIMSIDSKEISSIKVWDITGNLLCASYSDDLYSELPDNTFYILVAVLNNGDIVTQKIYKL